MRFPLLRIGTHRMMIPLWLACGFRNLLSAAEHVAHDAREVSGARR